MKYYLDTEFDGSGGPLLSLALVREDGDYLYCLMARSDHTIDPWVKENVVPHLERVEHIHYCQHRLSASRDIAEFFNGDPHPHVIADWPIDFVYFSMLLLPEPNMMIPIPAITMEVARVDAYPTDLPGAIQHNAYWDALALKHVIEAPQTGPVGSIGHHPV